MAVSLFIRPSCPIYDADAKISNLQEIKFFPSYVYKLTILFHTLSCNCMKIVICMINNDYMKMPGCMNITQIKIINYSFTM